MKLRQTRRKKQRGGAGNKPKNNTKNKNKNGNRNKNNNKWRTNKSQRSQALLRLALAHKL